MPWSTARGPDVPCLERGETAVHHVVVREALEAPEVEDEGPVYFVRDDTDVTLFFGGQFLSRLKQKGFPWTEFRILEAPGSRELFGIRAEGPAFQPVAVRSPLSYARAKALGIFERHYGPLEMDLEELKRDA